VKFVFFTALSGVTAAGRCTVGDIRSNEPLLELVRGVIAETAALARARGVALPATVEADTMATVLGLPDAMRASTAIDLEHGRPLEIEWISGAAKRLSEEAGLAAPLNSTLYALLSPYREGR
jgi:2-dehydropantoate 2-reductase